VMNKMSSNKESDSNVDDKAKIFVLPIKSMIIDDEDKKELTPRVAAYRLCRSIQNIYLELSSQQTDDYDEGNSYEEVQKSFVLREYGEMFLLRNIEDQIILDMYKNIKDLNDWNKAISPLNWGYLTFQEDPKVSFMMFLTMSLQNTLISFNSDRYDDHSKSELD